MSRCPKSMAAFCRAPCLSRRLSAATPKRKSISSATAPLPTASLLSPISRATGHACARSRRPSAALRSCSPPTRTVMAASAMAPGYNLDPKATYHDPALPPPHSYLATYAWLADSFRADAVIDLGKHGTLEWLPGKALALSAECFPEAVLGPAPHLYPFIVNDPGEGTQAKRRAQAVIIDHLTPPFTRAGSYGAQAELERLIHEYYH